MYWIYLVIFTFIVFIPSVVSKGFFFFNVIQTQEFAILFLGSLGFFVFLMMERKMKKNLAEKNKIQGQVNSMTKDLKYSYSYIGEINRKLDILENIALGYPQSAHLTHKNEMELYDSIIDAIRLFGKSDDFALRFVCLPNYEVVKEIKSIPKSPTRFSLKNQVIDFNYFESDEFIVTTSPKSIDNIFSYVVIKKKTPSQKIEDVEIMKTLASQALFIFMFMRNKKQIKCVL